MLYLVDGVKLHDPSSALAGNFTFLPPGLIERVEIVRGPLSNLYGSSAMGGVVNIITRSKEGLDFSLAGGSHGTLEGGVHFGKRLGRFSLACSADLLNYDDRLENDRCQRLGFSIHSRYEKDRLSAGLCLFGSLLASGIPMNLGAATPLRAYEQENYIISLPLQLSVGSRGHLDLTGSFHWNRYDFHDPQDAWTPQYGNESFMAEVQAKWTIPLLERIRLVSGADFSAQRIANNENSQALIPAAARNVASVYADLQADLGRVLLAGSLRLDHYAGLEAVLSPHFGLSYTPVSFLKLRASASRSFRAPALPEMLNPYWGNPALLPETGRSLEAGADLYGSALQCGITVFSSVYQNLIGFSPLTYKFANISRAEVSGAEVNADWRIRKGIQWRSAYTYLRTKDLQYDRELLRRPRHALTTSLLYQGRPLTLTAELTYIGKRLDYDELLFAVAENKSFSHVTVMAAIALGPNLSAFCRVTNAFNARFEEVMRYPAPRRRVLLGIGYQGKN
jgi:vitamin B12 transporter